LPILSPLKGPTFSNFFKKKRKKETNNLHLYSIYTIHYIHVNNLT